MSSLATLDMLHEAVGLGDEWMKSDRREEIRKNYLYLTQAKRYGVQVQQLEDLGLKKDRARVLTAWSVFLAQFRNHPYRQSILNAYTTATANRFNI